MEAEDSPWGDVPSGSSYTAPDPQSSTAEHVPSSPFAATSPTAKASTDSPAKPTGRTSRITKKVAVQATKLEFVDSSGDPLGPLGETNQAEEPPLPPLKEQALPIRSTRPVTNRGSEGTPATAETSSANQDALDSRQRPGLGLGTPEVATKQALSSVSVEQAARPKFTITVGDPHKVGDLTSSHIVYQVSTKTTSKAYRQPEFTVSRRYRDFLWLYTCLHNNNPGVVVPPPPEKQAVGRFDTNFVESRRAALERALNKTAAHPILQHDADLKIFLESDAFSVDVKHREHREIGFGESKGVLSSFGLGSSTAGKFVEHDDWFHDRKVYLDGLENQLKGLLKAIDIVVTQRKGLAEAAGDFSSSLQALASVELSESLSSPLAGLSGIQLRIHELYERQAQQDVLTLGITVDEYIRLIGSIKTAFGQRQKSWHSLHNADTELHRRRTTQDKILRSGKTQQDRLNQLQADVSDGERRCHQARLLYEDMGRLMRSELDRFEREKVEDFKSGVETFLEGAIEAQKELIEIWETFLMQFDADEEADPFIKSQETESANNDAKGEAETADQARPPSINTQSEGTNGEHQASSGNHPTVSPVNEDEQE